jgi:hypothetical protein
MIARPFALNVRVGECEEIGPADIKRARTALRGDK